MKTKQILCTMLGVAALAMPSAAHAADVTVKLTEVNNAQSPVLPPGAICGEPTNMSAFVELSAKNYSSVQQAVFTIGSNLRSVVFHGVPTGPNAEIYAGESFQYTCHTTMPMHQYQVNCHGSGGLAPVTIPGNITFTIPVNWYPCSVQQTS